MGMLINGGWGGGGGANSSIYGILFKCHDK